MDILATVHCKKKKKSPCTRRTSIFSWSSYRSTEISTRHGRSIIIILYVHIVNNISIPSSSKINFLRSRTLVPSASNSLYFYCYLCVCVCGLPQKSKEHK